MMTASEFSPSVMDSSVLSATGCGVGAASSCVSERPACLSSSIVSSGGGEQFRLIVLMGVWVRDRIDIGDGP